MQLISTLNFDSRAIKLEKSVGEHLPYLRHVDATTIATHDGYLLQVIKLNGLLFETADTQEINYRAQLRDAMLQTLKSSRFAVYHQVLRRKAESDMDASYPDPFSQLLNGRWQARLASRQMYVNDLFLTVVRRPPQGRIGWLERLGGWIGNRVEERSAAQHSELRALDAATQALIAALGGYGPKLLTIRDIKGSGLRSEPLEFLGCLLNAEMRPIALPECDLRDFLAWRRVSFGDRAFELDEAGTYQRKFGALISIKDYPAQTFPGMFDELFRMPFELTVSQSFAFVDQTSALDRMNLALRRMRSAEDEAISLRNDLDRAKDDVAAGRAGFGEHHTTIAVFGSTLGSVDAGVAEVTAALADLGVVGVREDIALEPTFWAQFPGNFKYISRRALVSTGNYAGLASLHNFPIGQHHNNHWGAAVTLFETTAAGPYFFNFHANDLGNFTVIGPSGSGKTVVLNFLLAQARKFNPRIVFFDKDRGAELFIRAIGGQYDRLRPGTGSGLNPLSLAGSAEDRQFLFEWLILLVGGVTAEEAAVIRDALEATCSAPPSHRRLRHLAELLRGHERPFAGDLYARMRPWVGQGERAWLFDNSEDLTDLKASTVGFDMTAILDDPIARTPALLYFFHRVEQRLDGSPAIIVVDEGWKALDDDVFVKRIKDWEKTIRKKNGIVGFATQSASDALESKIASAIIEQAATQIFMINPKARAVDYVDGFGLTPHEFELVRSLSDNSHCFLIKHGQDSVVARLNLTGEKDLLTILSGREETVRIFDDLTKAAGKVPDRWMDALLERV